MIAAEIPQTQEELLHSIAVLKRFMARPQLNTMVELVAGEEGEFFQRKLLGLADFIEDYMPSTKDRVERGKTDESMVYLHYFGVTGCDWFITHKDQEVEQQQAFGYCDPMGDKQMAELGYVSLEELFELRIRGMFHIELDLYWEPITLGELKEKKGYR